MLYYDSINVSEGINVNKISASKECNVCQCCYFLNYSFKFQTNACNKCNDLLLMSMLLHSYIVYIDITILNIKGSDYCCIISLIRKTEAINTD